MGMVEKDQLVSIRTELMAQGTVNRELLQELVGSSLIRAGHDPGETTSREAIEGIVRVRMEDLRRLIGPLLEALRKDADGEKTTRESSSLRFQISRRQQVQRN